MRTSLAVAAMLALTGCGGGISGDGGDNSNNDGGEDSREDLEAALIDEYGEHEVRFENFLRAVRRR